MKIKELVGKAGDDEKVTLTGAQVRTLQEEVTEDAKEAVAEEVTRAVKEEREKWDREYADASRTMLPEALRSELADIRVGRTRSAYENYTDDARAAGAGMVIRALASAQGRWDGEGGAKEYLRKWSEEIRTPEGDRVLRAITEGDYDSAGSLVQGEFSGEIIALLRNKTVIDRAGARTVEIAGGSTTFHKITGGTSAFYRGEGQSAPTSSMTVGQLTMLPKELVGRVPISNRLLKRASLSVDLMVRDDLVATLAEKRDLTFLRSAGSQYAPKGLRYLADASHIADVTEDTATPTLAQIYAELSGMMLQMEDANTGDGNLAFFASNRTKQFLRNVVDGDGRRVFKDEIDSGKLEGVTFLSTNQIPNNLGAGSESELILANMSEVLIGLEGQMVISVDKNVTYALPDGSLRSSYDVDETVVQAVEFHDFGVRYPKAVVVRTKVKWAN